MFRRFVLFLLAVVVAVPAFSITRTWTGANSGNWADAGNWSPSGTPASSDDLFFPAAASNRSMTNDLTGGSAFGPMTFDTGYTLGGNALTLTGSIAAAAPFTCAADLKVGAPSVVINAGTGGGVLSGAIDVNGQSLTLQNVGHIGVLNGSGTLSIQANPPAVISGSGNFSGTISGVIALQNASLPNATFSCQFLQGTGTTGPANIVTGFNFTGLFPNYGQPCCGVLNTGPLTLTTKLYVSLYPGGGADHVKVTGSVTLGGGATLLVNVPTGSLSVGQAFTLIDNDGTDPVSGTFSGMPEGSTFTIGPATCRLSYVGGDGNDVVVTVIAVTKSWTGAASANWSDPNNWSPVGVPTAGQTLTFPAGASHMAMTNDLPAGTVVGPMTFDTGYTLGGNALTLTGSIDAVAPFTCAADLKVGAPSLVISAGTGGGVLSGAIDVNGQTLTLQNVAQIGVLNGSGTLSIQANPPAVISGNGNFSGTISGVIALQNASLPNATFNCQFLQGTGTTGPANIVTGFNFTGLFPNYGQPCCGVLNTGPLTLTTKLYVSLYPDTGADYVKVTGGVTLGAGATLLVNVAGGAPLPGQAFTVIDNDGTDPVNGTFSGLPEGATFSVAPYTFGVTYHGGDGNDVVITRMASTGVTLTQDNGSTRYGEAVTFTATMTSEFGVPGGIITFTDGATTLGTAALQNGKATFTTSALTAGSHDIVATYATTIPWMSSSSALTHVVTKVTSTLNATTNPSPSYAGQPFALTAHVGPLTGATGTITVSESTRTIATQSLTNAAATIELNGLRIGDNALVVSYSGDTNYEPASTTVHQTILPPALFASNASTNGDKAHAITIPVTLSAPLALPASVDYATADDGALAGTNYASTNGTLTFAPGQLIANITLNILGNTAIDPLSFKVNLSNAVNATIATPTITITIIGNSTATTYEYAPGLTIDFYPATNAKSAAPLILWIPGFISYDSAQDPIPALRETARGYAIARVGYRPAGKAPYPAQLDDLVSALTWIRANATTLNIDPNRIGAWGFGAGAHLAMLLGANNHLQAVIDCSGATDLPHLDNDALACSSVVHNAASSPESQLLGCALSSCSSLALSASPIANVTSSDAPTLILHGDGDCMISPLQAIHMYDAVRFGGVYTQLFLVRGMGHDDVWNASGMPAEIDSFLDIHLRNLGSRPRPSTR